MGVEITLIEEHHRPHIQWLCSNLSAADRAEVMAVQFAEDPELLAEQMMRSKGFAWMATVDGRPAAIYGASCMWPNVWQAFAFGTEDYRHVIVSLTRHCRRFCIPALTNYGVRMVHVWVQASYLPARNWIRMTFPGSKEECVVDGFGKDGEPFVLVTWRPQEAQTWAH